MKRINCKNSDHKWVQLFNNGEQVIAMAMQDEDYWFTIGHYKKETTAIRCAAKKMAQFGYII